jgi:integrase/recombinase XerD
MNSHSKSDQGSLTIVEHACQEIPGFKKLYKKLDDKIQISGHSISTFNNYARKLALISLHFGKLPQEVKVKDINKHLASLVRQTKSPSKSDFKFYVYSLRYCYRLLGLKKKMVQLPKLKKDKKLPVVLNLEECKALFTASKQLKHRLILSLIYSAGMRTGEALRLKLADVDIVRMTIHIRQSKCNKDRYVPLSPKILDSLQKYLKDYQPVEYLFNGNKPGIPLSATGIKWALQDAIKKSKIQKKINLHSLRHSYATHLLEYGLDIGSIMYLLGHSRIETTMMYLHVAQFSRKDVFSPYDML